MKQIKWDIETDDICKEALAACGDMPIRFAKGLPVKFTTQLEDGWHIGTARKREGGLEILISHYRLFTDCERLYQL